ncbi:potassium channel, subfamily K, member 16-like [Branchiostoma floridae x Branchiostoma belcheri]
MKGKVVALLVFLNLCWLLIGGGVFSALEWQNESAQRVNYEDYRSRLLRNFSCLTEEEVANFITAVVTATNAGLTLDNSTAADTSNWDFGNSFFFSSTVVTTIGYGHISPSTRGGQAFLIPYALIGIPLCGLMLNGIGENIGGYVTKKKEQWAKKRWSKKVSERTAEVLVMLILFLLFLVFLVFIPSAIFLALEGWSYNISIYYSFVTLTTIGFGDYVPGQNSDQRVVYRLAILCWFMIGLAWMAVILNQVSTFLTEVGVKAQTARDERRKKKDGDKGEGEDNKAAEDVENSESTKSVKQSNVELRSMTPIES